MHHKNIDFKKELQRAWNIALLKKTDMHHVEHGGKMETTFGYYVITAYALLSAIGLRFFNRWFTPSVLESIINIAVQIVMTIVVIYLLSLIAEKVFKGKGKHDAFFRVMAYAMIVGWISIIWPLSLIGGLWFLFLTFRILKDVHKIDNISAIGTIILGIIVLMVLSKALSPMMGAIYYL